MSRNKRPIWTSVLCACLMVVSSATACGKTAADVQSEGMKNFHKSS